MILFFFFVCKKDFRIFSFDTTCPRHKNNYNKQKEKSSGFFQNKEILSQIKNL